MGTRGGNLPVTLGIDASLRRPGLALLDAGGALVDWWRPDGTRASPRERAAALAGTIRSVLVAHPVEQVAVETAAGARFGGRSTLQAVESLAQARGIVWGTVSLADPDERVTVRELHVSHVRSRLGLPAVLPRGRAKELVAEVLRLRGYTLPRDARGRVLDDVADAVALAWCAQIEATLLAALA